MRIKILIISLVLIMVSLTITGCSSNNAVGLGEEFYLRIGESTSLKKEELQIKFVEVTEDSRCPKGVVCVWEGRVSSVLEITYRGSLHQVVLIEPGTGSWPPEYVFEEYKISYHVEPYPQAGDEIEKEEYYLELTISI